MNQRVIEVKFKVVHFLKIKRFENLFYDQNKNRPQLKTPEKVFHMYHVTSLSVHSTVVHGGGGFGWRGLTAIFKT